MRCFLKTLAKSLHAARMRRATSVGLRRGSLDLGMVWWVLYGMVVALLCVTVLLGLHTLANNLVSLATGPERTRIQNEPRTRFQRSEEPASEPAAAAVLLSRADPACPPTSPLVASRQTTLRKM